MIHIRSYLLCILLSATTIALPNNRIGAGTVCLFSPDDKITDHLIDTIKGAQKSIRAAVYMFTDKDIAQALIDAQTRKVKVSVIVDPISCMQYGKAQLLYNNKIPVFVYNPKVQKDDKWFSSGPIMHNKFMIIDDELLWTGSFNWTLKANKSNSENVIITKDIKLCKAFSNHHTQLIKNRCHPFLPSTDTGKNNGPQTLKQKVISAARHAYDDNSLIQELTALLAQYATAQ